MQTVPSKTWRVTSSDAPVPAGAFPYLMACGHRDKGSCEDIELVVAPAPDTAAAISEAANTVQFPGKAPLSEAVRRAAAELKSTRKKPPLS